MYSVYDSQNGKIGDCLVIRSIHKNIRKRLVKINSESSLKENDHVIIHNNNCSDESQNNWTGRHVNIF